MAVSTDISVWIAKLETARLAFRRSSPDLVAQLKASLKRPVDRFVCISTDSETALDLIARFARDHVEALEAGVALIGELIGVRPHLITPGLTGAYPSLEPSLLVRRRFGRTLRFDALPTDAGVLMIDAITAVQVGAIVRNETIDQLPVVIDDHAGKRRVRLSLRPDVTVADAMRLASLDPCLLQLHQGPLLQQRTVTPATPIGQTELWLHARSCQLPPSARACTRCGECFIACPVHLHPAALLEAAQQPDPHMGERFHLRACIECGLCDQVCPSNLPLLASFRTLKTLAT
jgi:electron transport complex protein RnfC